MPTKKGTTQQPALFDLPAHGAAAAKKQPQPRTNAQQLGSIIKSARDMMRKDKGLNGDLDRLPMLTWIMFLKFLDDTEQIRADEAALEGRLFRKEFNLHTIMRLPNGVFAPYTGIPTNLLFFDRSGPTQEVWYYEQPLPAGRKNYTKTQSIQFEEFADCLTWWNKREENERAWKVPAAAILANGCNLDIKNPNGKKDLEHLPPEQLADSILRKEQQIVTLMAEIKALLGTSGQ